MARCVTFPFIRSSRRRLPGPDNEWMSKTQQLIQTCGEQRRKNTVGRRLVLERSSSLETLSPKRDEIDGWEERGEGTGEESKKNGCRRGGSITGSEVATSGRAQ